VEGGVGWDRRIQYCGKQLAHSTAVRGQQVEAGSERVIARPARSCKGARRAACGGGPFTQRGDDFTEGGPRREREPTKPAGVPRGGGGGSKKKMG